LAFCFLLYSILSKMNWLSMFALKILAIGRHFDYSKEVFENIIFNNSFLRFFVWWFGFRVMRFCFWCLFIGNRKMLIRLIGFLVAGVTIERFRSNYKGVGFWLWIYEDIEVFNAQITTNKHPKLPQMLKEKYLMNVSW
jgi:hypothetical protein